MTARDRSDEELLEKIKSLPPEEFAEVDGFVDFLRQGNDERSLAHTVTKLSDDAFHKVRDDPDDAEYDRL